ncbi:hypothetical protein E4U41_005363, partial [Claviceps citrina]
MADSGISRFTPQNRSTHERLSTTTVGLVALSDFRKRRAELLEQQEREAREAAVSGTSTPDPSLAGTPDNAGSDAGGGAGAGGGGRRRPGKRKTEQQQEQRKKSKIKTGKKLLSFDDDDDGDDDDDHDGTGPGTGGDENDVHHQGDAARPASPSRPEQAAEGDGDAAAAAAGAGAGNRKRDATGTSKVKANASVGIIPRPVTKAALLREAAEREALRREFVAVQEAVKATEIAIPFIFYDGSNVPAGTVRVHKGDFVWVFLDKSRKVGAERRPGERGNARRAWARVGVDDLMLVRDTIIIPHHYDFYYFLINKTYGPGGRRLFDFTAEAPPIKEEEEEGGGGGEGRR